MWERVWEYGHGHEDWLCSEEESFYWFLFFCIMIGGGGTAYGQIDRQTAAMLVE